MAESSERKRMTRAERRAYWREHIVQWGRSGKSKQAYCREHGLKPANLYRWCARLGDGAQEEVRFVQVQLPAHTGNAYSLELALGGGRVLRIGTDAEPRWVAQLVEALERVC